MFVILSEKATEGLSDIIFFFISFTFSSLAIEFYSERKLVKTACFLEVSESGENHFSLEKLIARESRTLCENKSPHFTFTAHDFHCGFLPFLKMDARRRLNEMRSFSLINRSRNLQMTDQVTPSRLLTCNTPLFKNSLHSKEQ